MCHDHGQEVLRWQVKAEKLSDLLDSVSDLCFLVQDELVNDLAKDFLSIRLDLALDANNQVVELTEGLLFQVDLQGVFLKVFKDRFN